MKKLFALLLAVVMMMSLATVAFAEDTYPDMSEVTITKNYLNPNNGVSPEETFRFKIDYVGVTHAGVDYDEATVKANLPTVASVTFDEGDAGKVVIDGTNITYACQEKIVVTLPEYAAVGVYEYKITEEKGAMAGVTYYDKDIKLVVTVVEENGLKRIAAVHTEIPAATGAAKKDIFSNIYESGTLSVNKQVTGNLGDLNKDFNVTVIFTAPEGETVGAPIWYTDDGEKKTIAANWTGSTSVEIDLKHDETVTFTNIPEGVTYEVVEDSYSNDGYDAAKYEFSDNNKIVNTGVDGNTNDDNVVITNNKETVVDTGILMDSAPYVVMLLVAAAGLVLFTNKRRVQD